MPDIRVWEGRAYPLGATVDEWGVNFALFSAGATKVELCLFDKRKRLATNFRYAKTTSGIFTLKG